MNCSDYDDTTRQRERGNPAPGPDPLRRKVMSALGCMVDKHRRVLEEDDPAVITTHLDLKEGKFRETVMAVTVTVTEGRPPG